jgi:RNA polymerase sigma-B factor
MSPDRAPENASLPAKDERGMALLAAMADAPTEAERGCRREAVIRYYLPDATGLAHRFRHRGVPNDDLHQVAAMALVMAVDRFDPARGKPFIGFLIPTVLGEIRRYFRDRTWAVRAPRALQERCLAITNATDRLAQQLGRSPTVKDLARELDLTVDEVLEGLECGWAAYTAGALTGPTDDDWQLPAAADRDLELVEDWQALQPLLRQLPERDRRILRMRFIDELTQAKIAEQIGVSQMHVSRLLTSCLDHLRTSLLAGT